MGRTRVERISFPLGPALAKRKVAFSEDELLSVDTERKVVATTRGEQGYDVLVIATGHRSANEALPGLGPQGGFAHSLMPERRRSATSCPSPIVTTSPRPKAWP